MKIEGFLNKNAVKVIEDINELLNECSAPKYIKVIIKDGEQESTLYLTDLEFSALLAIVANRQISPDCITVYEKLQEKDLDGLLLEELEYVKSHGGYNGPIFIDYKGNLGEKLSSNFLGRHNYITYKKLVATLPR